MRAGRPPGRIVRLAAAAIALGSLAALTVWLFVKQTRGAEIANVVALPVSVGALYAAVVPLYRQQLGEDAGILVANALTLSGQVYEREASEQNRLLAETARGLPADVGFAQPVRIHWRTDGGSQRGTLYEIANYYDSLGEGRLMVLGPPGAGKTVMIDQPLLDMLERIRKGHDPQDGPAVVPVRFSLPAFDTIVGDEAQHRDNCARFDRWLAENLKEAYRVLRPAESAALVRAGLILPVLDGLDEMDPEGHEPVRAAAVLRVLNEPTSRGLRRVIVACRQDRFAELAAMPPSRAGDLHILQDATAVILEPLAPDEATAHIVRRFHDLDTPEVAQRRWQPLIREMERHPNGAIAMLLRSPLRLFMMVTAYATEDPGDLLRLPRRDLNDHLFSKLITEIAKQHRDKSKMRYAAADVTTWLTTIARFLRQQGRDGRSESDLGLHLLWTVAGRRKPRYIAAALYGLVSLLLLIPPYAWYIHTTGRLVPLDTWGWLVVAVGVTPVFLASGRALSMDVSLRRLDLDAIRSRPGRQRLAKDIARWLLVGMGFGALFAIPYGPGFGAAFGVACGAGFGIAFGLGRRPAAVEKPGALVAQGIAHDVVVVLNFGLAFGLANGFANGLLDGLAGGVTFGFCYGTLFGLVYLAKSPWPRYFIAMRILARAGDLPSSPAQFLDWAHQAGLIRQSGISCQFRHRELQDRLL